MSLLGVGWQGGLSSHISPAVYSMVVITPIGVVYFYKMRNPTLEFWRNCQGIRSAIEGLHLMLLCPAFLEEALKLSENLMAISVRNGLKVPFQYS